MTGSSEWLLMYTEHLSKTAGAARRRCRSSAPSSVAHSTWASAVKSSLAVCSRVINSSPRLIAVSSATMSAGWAAANELSVGSRLAQERQQRRHVLLRTPRSQAEVQVLGSEFQTPGSSANVKRGQAVVIAVGAQRR